MVTALERAPRFPAPIFQDSDLERDRPYLCKTDISDPIRFVNLDPDKVLGWACVLNIVSRVIWEYSGVPSGKVEGACVGPAEEDCRSCGSRSEI